MMTAAEVKTKQNEELSKAMGAKVIGARLDGLSVAQLRTVWTAACRELGISTNFAMQSIDSYKDSTPRELCGMIMWLVNCNKRTAAKTGRKEWYCSDKTFGTMRSTDVEIVSWEESNNALNRIFATVGR